MMTGLSLDLVSFLSTWSSPVSNELTRRTFVKSAAAAASALAAPMIVPSSVLGDDKNLPVSDRVTLGFIGVGSRGMSHVDGLSGRPNVHAVAACDVDKKYLERAKNSIGERNRKLGRGEGCDTYSHYEELIQRKDLDVVVITTPDHWHTKIAVEAMRAGKHVYCEKPLTLTIDEGKIICKVVEETGRIFQVGTQQRSDRKFIEAVTLVRNGHIGKVLKVTCAIGGGDKGGPFKVEQPPTELDWERWQGQVALTPYIKQKCHYQFRWWYEYSGGKMTDWGAHHVDIAQWGCGLENTGPILVQGTSKDQGIYNGYTTATEFNISCKFENGTELILRHDGANGITFEGEKGTIFVSRGKRTGAFENKPGKPAKPAVPAKDKNPEVPAEPAVAQEKAPITEEDLIKTYKGAPLTDHYTNFINAVKDKKQPISDVFSHHRIITTCHLANIAIRLERPLKWDPVKQEIVDDKEANGWLKRAQRAGYEIKA